VSLLTGLLRTPGYHPRLPSFPLLEVRVVHRSNGGTRSAVANRSRQEAGRSERSGAASPRPRIGQRGPELQEYGTIARLPNGLGESTCQESVEALNQQLADAISLRDLYKKAHWQVAGHTFYQLHLLFDKHYEEQVELVDMIAERIQLLGGISLAMGADVAEETRIPRPPRGREEVPVQISRLLEAHQLILKHAHEAAKAADEAGDDGTNDLLVSNVIRTNELQVWFLAEHLVDVPVVEADEE
jgi:starvation-inducible DNA-binding protein